MATRRPLVVVNGVTSELPSGDTTPTNSVAPGTARQLLQTNAGGTATEWTSNVDVPGTLDVTSTATFDSIAQYPAGSAGAPTITFTGDTNTGIYSPGADQVAISTGGSGRLFVDASGNVGVGQSSPAVYFDIFKSGATQADLRVRNGTSGLNFAIKADGTADISNVLNYPITFTTGTSPSEKVRITSAGLVGVGTSSPGATLHVNGGSASRTGYFVSTDASAYSPTSYSQYHRLYLQGGSATNAYNGIGFTNGSNSEGFIGFVQNASGYGDFVIQSFAGSYAEKLRVTSAGNVGVGTTAVSSRLHVLNLSGGSSTAEVSTVERDNSGYFLKLYRNAGSGNTGGLIGADSAGTYYTGGHNTQNMIYIDAGNGVMQFYTNNAERARIDSSGRLGIGTSSPVNRLDVNGSISAAGSFSNTGYAPAVHVGLSGGNPTIGSGNNVASTYLPLVFTRETTTGSAESMRIDASGRVGIGTTAMPADTNLTVLGNYQSGFYRNVSSGGRAYVINIGATSPSGFIDGASITGGVEGGDASGSLLFGTRTSGTVTEKARIDSSGRLLVGTSTALTNVLIKGDLGSSAATTPQEQFALATNSYNAGLSVTNYSASGYGGVLSLNSSKSNTLGTNALVDNTIAVGTISFNGNDGTNFVPCAEIKAAVDGTPGANDMPGRLVFSTTSDGASSPTERMRIDSGGNLIVAGISTGAAGSIALRGDGLLQSKPVYGFAVSVSTRAMYMDSDGLLGYITSVRESKTNIKAQSNVDWLYELEPVSFNYKTKDRKTGEYIGVDPQPQFGLIAEDVEGVCPELCFYDQTESGKELRGVQYEKLITPMLKALQQANQRIETLEAEVAALKAS